MPDGNGGWLISQTDANATSTLTAVGDLNGDGSDDLIVSNAVLSVAAVDTSNSWSALGNGASSLASPALAQLGDVLYMAVQSNTGGNNIYWSSSTDNGGSWADFQALPTDMTSVRPPSLAVFDGTLYLSYLGDGNNEINITSLTDPDTNSWSEQYLIPWSGGTQSALDASLVTESVDGNDQLALYYISNNADQSELLRTATTNPVSSGGWSQQINVEYNDARGNQTASGPLVVVSSNGQTVIAYQGGTITNPSNEIYFATSSTPSNAGSWSAQAVLDPGQQTGLGLVDSGTHGLLLSYSDNTDPAALQLQSFEYENGSWNNTKSLSTPLMASGSNDVSILRSTATAAETIVFAGINASNSNALEVKLASTTTSNTGLRLISGAGSAQAFAEINDATALKQIIQLAPALAGAKGVETISAAVTAAGTLSLSAASTSDAYGVSGSFSDPATLVASSDSIASAQQLFSNAFASDAVGWSSTPISPPTGDLALNTTTSFGDLNGDGYNDYFDPESSIWIASAPEAPVFSLWSIRAAGDVNGNGVDDVLLALTPQGPSYQAQSDGKPAAIYSALIDGALFNVTNNSFNLSDLKAALNPYNSTELFDVTTMSYSDEYQSLQSWFSPILKYQAPIEIDSVSTLVEGDSAYTQFATNATYNNSPAPALVHDASGNLYSITTQVFAGGDNTGIRLSNTLLLGVGQDSLDPNAINVTPIDLTQASPPTVGGETFPSDSIAPLTPGAAIHDGKLYVAIPSARSSSGYGSSSNNIWIAYADLNNSDKPLDEPSSWTTYQVQSNGGVTDENSLLTPTLVSEGERLALYFPSGSEGNNDVNLNIRYLYSNDPTQQAGWGSSLSSTTNTYTGTSSTISIDASLSQPPSKGGWASESGVIVTSPIAASTYQGRTVLAFRGYADGGGDNVENGGLLLAFAPTARGAQANSTSSSSADWTLWDSGTTGINTPSIATDQANLYLTYTPWSTSATNAFFFPVALNIEHLSPNQQVDLSASNLVTAGETVELPITLQQAGDDNTKIGGNNTNTGMTSPYYAGGYFKHADTQANNIGNAPQSVTPSFFGDALYVTNQVGESAAVAIKYDHSAPAFGANQINQAGLSLAGYSLDGNIDVNGDGFTDILLSDPSDPSLDVNNQYVLFGGDYLDIASWVGTAGNDVAVGTPLADVIYTMAGDDAVTSHGGADVIYTGAGADSVSITGNSFIRIDTGSGIDQLLLEGDVNQAYDFRLAVDSPEYFAGTKLRNIELISSLDYGANTLSFDPAAVSAFNDDRMLFVIPDASDIINLYSDPVYSFQRNSNYDTSFGGVVWNAYASELTSAGTSLDPALLYVLNPVAGDDTWLDDHVDVDPAATVSSANIASFSLFTAADASNPVGAAQLPQASAVASQQDFGNGLRLIAFKDGHSSGVSRFEVYRSDASFRQVVAYASTSANSSVEPGLDTSAIAGQLVLEAGESSQLITVPFDQERIALQRQAGISLQVEEVPDVGQQELHLVISSQTGDETSGDLLSGFQLAPIEGSHASVLSFRMDTETPDDNTSSALLGSSSDRSADGATTSATLESEPSPPAAELIVHRRHSADASISDPGTVSQLITVSEATAEASVANFDHDGFANQQVGIELLLNTQPGSSVVSLITTDSRLAPLTALGSIPQSASPDPGPSPAPTPSPQPTAQPSPAAEPDPSTPVEAESPINASGSVDYAVINSGMADFSAITPEQYAEISWAEVDFTAIAQSPGSAESLDYGLINYRKVASAESFSALAEIIQYDDLTGSNIRAIAANSNSQGSFDVVIGERGEKLRLQGSELNDLFQVRGGGRLVARGGGGRDLYYSNSRKSEMVIKDFSSEDLVKLDRFGDGAVRKGKLRLFQEGQHALISFKGDTLLTLRKTDAERLIFSQGSITLAPDPLA
ncbi:MAG: hypothetical protein KFB97_06385 [Cyanobium sp. M30B3]|nr:MAG: hypothetical protein KFB97_06385 [Cyanobium sp. M30B3]